MGRYSDKINTSPKQKKIKKALEEIGHTNIEVWWENLGAAVEMCGMSGGYFFHSDQEEHYPLGLSFDEVIELISRASWLKVKSK
jgi:hypothetical protein